MTAVRGLAADVADLRNLVADLAAEATRVATAVAEFGAYTELVEIMKLAHGAGYSDGRAERDEGAAIARAAERRAQFKLIPGGKPATPEVTATAAPKASKAPAKARARRPAGGAS